MNETDGKPEKPKYARFTLGDEACMFSYLSRSGFTLTVVLRSTDGSAVGFASNDKTWVPVRGTFEVSGDDGRTGYRSSNGRPT
jgi:hypothetical protein